MQATNWIIIITDYPVTQNVKNYVPWMTVPSHNSYELREPRIQPLYIGQIGSW